VASMGPGLISPGNVISTKSDVQDSLLQWGRD